MIFSSTFYWRLWGEIERVYMYTPHQSAWLTLHFTFLFFPKSFFFHTTIQGSYHFLWPSTSPWPWPLQTGTSQGLAHRSSLPYAQPYAQSTLSHSLVWTDHSGEVTFQVNTDSSLCLKFLMKQQLVKIKWVIGRKELTSGIWRF